MMAQAVRTFKRLWPVVLGLLVATFAILPLGCATTDRPQLFFGNQVLPAGTSGPHASLATPDPREPDIIVEGSSQWDLSGQTISLTFSNRAATPIRFGYLVDEYVARTADGRAVVLEKDFLSYPGLLPPGSTASVMLSMTKGVFPTEITHIVATINNGRTVIILHSARHSASAKLQPSVASQARGAYAFTGHTGRSSKVAGTIPAPALVPPPRADSLPDPRLAGTVPVVVEFSQALGSTLGAAVRWNQEVDTTRLEQGDQETFYLLPGRHELYFMCPQPPLVPTEGRVPVIARTGEPMRVALDARARVEGAEVKVAVWTGTRRVWHRVFQPSSGTR